MALNPSLDLHLYKAFKVCAQWEDGVGVKPKLLPKKGRFRGEGGRLKFADKYFPHGVPAFPEPHLFLNPFCALSSPDHFCSFLTLAQLFKLAPWAPPTFLTPLPCPAVGSSS